MCRYFGYALATYALVLGTFYAAMLYDIIQSVRGLSAPLYTLSALVGGYGGGGGDLLPRAPAAAIDDAAATDTAESSAFKLPPLPEKPDLASSTAAIHQMINENFADEKKRDAYLREFLPDCGLEERHFEELNRILDNFKIDKLKNYEAKLRAYLSDSAKVASADVRERALKKLDEFSGYTTNIDSTIHQLARQVMGHEL